MTSGIGNDGRVPDEDSVSVRYPLNRNHRYHALRESTDGKTGGTRKGSASRARNGLRVLPFPLLSGCCWSMSGTTRHTCCASEIQSGVGEGR